MALHPHRAGSELLKLEILGKGQDKEANMVFATIQDRRGRSILSVRDQNTFDEALRPVPGRENEGAGYLQRGQNRGGPNHRRHMNHLRIGELLAGDRAELGKLIRKAK